MGETQLLEAVRLAGAVISSSNPLLGPSPGLLRSNAGDSVQEELKFGYCTCNGQEPSVNVIDDARGML